MNSSSNFVAASPRQLWALFCITHSDYRGKGLSREEAASLIKELGNPDYKKASKGKTLEEEFVEYFKEHGLPKVVASLKSAIGIESVVAEDTSMMKGTGPNNSARCYKMRGFGCSISYLTYDKRSKKAKEIAELFRELRFKKFRDMVEAQFDKKLLKKLEAEGTPLGALYCQDYDVNSTLFNEAVNFAKSKGVKKIDYVTRLD